MERQDMILAAEAKIQEARTPSEVTAPIAEEEDLEQDIPEVTADPVNQGEDDHEGHEESTPHVEGQEPVRRHKSGAKKRIDELTREKHEERRARERAEAELAMYRQQAQQAQAPQHSQQPQRQDSSKPTLEAHDYDQESYMEALADWKAEQKIQGFRDEISRFNNERQVQEKTTRFQDRIKQFEKEVPGGWEQAIQAPIETTPVMLEAISESEIGPKIAYYLSQNLDEAYSVSRMSPLHQAVAIGRIEAKLQAAGNAPKRPQSNVTRAPAPAPQIQSGSHVGKSLDRYGIEDHIAAVQALKKSKYGF